VYLRIEISTYFRKRCSRRRFPVNDNSNEFCLEILAIVKELLKKYRDEYQLRRDANNLCPYTIVKRQYIRNKHRLLYYVFKCLIV